MYALHVCNVTFQKAEAMTIKLYWLIISKSVGQLTSQKLLTFMKHFEPLI